jgi:uncharacterized membrane protein
MAKFLSRALTAVLVFSYGLFTLVLYGLIAVKNGTYFKRPTEKEELELQLGESADDSLTDR